MVLPVSRYSLLPPAVTPPRHGRPASRSPSVRHDCGCHQANQGSDSQSGSSTESAPPHPAGARCAGGQARRWPLRADSGGPSSSPRPASARNSRVLASEIGDRHDLKDSPRLGNRSGSKHCCRPSQQFVRIGVASTVWEKANVSGDRSRGVLHRRGGANKNQSSSTSFSRPTEHSDAVVANLCVSLVAWILNSASRRAERQRGRYPAAPGAMSRH
jgi:hypothetical protein